MWRSTRKLRKARMRTCKSYLKSTGNPDDLFYIGLKTALNTFAVVVYLETLVDSNLLGQHVIEPMNKFIRRRTPGTTHAQNQLKLILSASKLIEINDLHHAIDRLLAGYALILLNNADKIFAVSLPGFARRGIEEAPTEKVIKGPREGFTETIGDNIGLIRRYIKDPNLQAGKETDRGKDQNRSCRNLSE